MIEALHTAILAKDVQGVLSTLSGWSEQQREAARRPLAIMLLALGFDKHYIRALEVDLDVESPEVVAKRKRDGIVPMSRKAGTYDYAMVRIAWLACYGVSGQSMCEQSPFVPDHEAESATILADRRPPWLDDWLAAVTNTNWEESSGMSASFWCRLFQHGLVRSVNDDWVSFIFAQQLADAFSSATEATQCVLQEVTSAREAIYEVPHHPYQLSVAKSWTPVVEWLGKEKLLDHRRLLSLLIDALHGSLNQSERNGCVIIAKAASKKSSGCTPETLAELQSLWNGLLSDHQAVVVGFGLDQILAVEKADLLDCVDVVDRLPGIFQHKPKTHAMKAVSLLGRIAEGKADLRANAVNALAAALQHPNKDVQASAIDHLLTNLKPTDVAAIAQLQMQTATVAPTLRPRLSALISATSTTTEIQDEPPIDAAPSKRELQVLEERAATIPATTKALFRVSEAIEAARTSDIDSAGQWRITDVQVLKGSEVLNPIETLGELIDVTAAAVERCEGGDTADRIVDGIARLGTQRPEHFEAMTGALRSRACGGFWDRPNRGIVGGVLGAAFSHLIAVWLGATDDDEDEMLVPELYPMGVFFREVTALLKKGNAYPLLSTPTHHGGWIDPAVWVQRLRENDSAGGMCLESDLIRSLLRLAPDGRREAWRMICDTSESLSIQFQKLAKLALDLDEPNKNIQLDDSWSPFVWMAAIRARDPWIDLEEHLPPHECSQLSAHLWALPDVLKPADYQWRVVELRPRASDRGLVETSPTQMESDRVDSYGGQALGAKSGGFLASQLNYLRCLPAPPYIYPYLATQWPMKLDWYWAMATVGLSRRVESGPSIEERYDQFLLPLFEMDRPVCPMAARALWIATVSKDGNARSMATEVWIVLISEDRWNIEILVEAWRDVSAGGWMKANRIAEVLKDVGAVSTLHTFVVARLLEAFLAACKDLPTNPAKLLEVLDECNECLGRSVPGTIRETLGAITSGKAKKLAKSLLDRQDNPTPDRMAAVYEAVDSRMQRAERNASATSSAG